MMMWLSIIKNILHTKPSTQFIIVWGGNKMREISEELERILTERLEEGMSQSVIVYNAVNALAGLLVDKGIIQSDEFVKAFIEELEYESFE